MQERACRPHPDQAGGPAELELPEYIYIYIYVHIIMIYYNTNILIILIILYTHNNNNMSLTKNTPPDEKSIGNISSKNTKSRAGG